MTDSQQQLSKVVKVYLKLSTGKLASDGFLPRVNLDKALIEQTQQFYASKSGKIINETNLIDYLTATDKLYTEEKNRTIHIFNWDIGEEILKTFRQEMLVKPQAQLLSKGNGFQEFIQNNRYEDIKLLYKLYKQEPDNLKPIGEQFRAFIAEEGKQLLKQVELHNAEGKLLDIKEIIS